MCNFDKGFILCTCEKEGESLIKKEPLTSNVYFWTLFKSMSYIEPSERGRYVMPVSDIDNGLTNEFVFEQLNSRPCFDFEYEPEDNDNLFIHKGKIEPYLSFIFRDGVWVDGRTVNFDTAFDDILKGRLKFLRYE